MKNTTDRKLSAINEWITKGQLPKVIYFTESKFVFNMQKFYLHEISLFRKIARDAQHFTNLNVGLRLFEQVLKLQ